MNINTTAGGELAKPTIVLVHGGLEDASIWHAVIPRLQRDGYPVVAFANPLRSLGIDVAYLRSLLDGIKGSVILVSHAYGGAVITQAGDDPKVKGLVYAASPMPAVGECLKDCLERFPGFDFASSVNVTKYTMPDGTSGAYALVRADKFRALLAADVPEGETRLDDRHAAPARLGRHLRAADLCGMDEQAELADQASQGFGVSFRRMEARSRSRQLQRHRGELIARRPHHLSGYRGRCNQPSYSRNREVNSDRLNL